MFNITITKSKKRRVAAALVTVFAVGFFIASPDSLSAVSEHVPWVVSFFLPFFMLTVIASILLDVVINSKRIWLAAKIIVVLYCLLAVYTASEFFMGSYFWVPLTENPPAFLMGFLLLIALASFFFALIGSVPWALRCMTIVVILYCLVNYYVHAFRGTLFIPTDILSMGTAMDVASSYFFFWTYPATEAMLVFVGVFVLFPRLKFPRLKKVPRIVVRVVALVLPLVFVGVTIQRDFVRGLGIMPYTWQQGFSAWSNGSVWNFYSNISESYAVAPNGYTEEAADEIAARYTSDSVDEAEETPDVILILGESWADVTPEGYVEVSEEILPYMKSLQNQDNSDFEKLIVSVFGGGTSRSELHVLTGASQEYGTSQAPFQFDVTEHIPNLVDTFNALGYDSTALHPGLAESWGRDLAFPLMGFDAYYDKFSMVADENDQSNYLREWVRDSVMYDEALEILESADSPQFLYLITIATHGAFRNESYASTVTIEEPAGEFDEVEQYLSVLHESDVELEAFIKELEQRERPTLLVFFGDHLPYLSAEYKDLVLEPSNPLLWRYTTFYGVWANYELPTTVYDDAEYMSINYLGLYLLEKAKLPLTGYQKFLREGFEEYPVVSTSGFMTPEGRLLTIEEAQETTVYQEQAIIQYNLIYDRDKLPEGFYTLRE